MEKGKPPLTLLNPVQTLSQPYRPYFINVYHMKRSLDTFPASRLHCNYALTQPSQPTKVSGDTQRRANLARTHLLTSVFPSHPTPSDT